MRRRWSLTPYGASVVILLVVGVLLAIAGSHLLQVVGYIVLIFAVALAGVAMLGADTLQLDPRGARPPSPDVVGESKAEYIETAGTPSEEAWAREQERYRRPQAQMRRRRRRD